MNIIVTGCAGFIGSNLVETLLQGGNKVYGIDVLTYAGNLDNLIDFQYDRNFSFYKSDIRETDLINFLFEKYDIQCVVNLAAETHVDNSINDCSPFIDSNIYGVSSLLNAMVGKGIKFIHFSTDEVYGTCLDGSFDENTPLNPRNPYSATKAGGDHLIKSYDNTYGFKSIIVRPSNNFGPKQHSEKLIPTIMRSIKEGKPVPVYGKGENIRDWLYVKDTTNAIKHLITNGVPGETYNITAKNEVKNIDLINSIFKIYKTLHGEGKAEIDFVKDRPGHDWRYSITNDKLIATGFEEFGNFNKQLIETIKWYMQKK